MSRQQIFWSEFPDPTLGTVAMDMSDIDDDTSYEFIFERIADIIVQDSEDLDIREGESQIYLFDENHTMIASQKIEFSWEPVVNGGSIVIL